ncbi:MAG: chemotaxis protein CheB [Planktomarina sp.]
MSEDDKETDLTIIGVGSSAGGLEAIRELLSTLPANLPVSYVVVQHMSPKHKSLMTTLVARHTDLTVEDVKDQTVPKPNVVYVTPPNNDVVFKDGMLCLRQPSQEPSRPKPSVDRFLVSLAENHGEKSMAIILSGTGSDGAYGVQAIREVGGITLAQDNDSAKYDGMPLSAVQTGCIDLILRPSEIGTHLAKILTSNRDFSTFRSGTLQETPVSDLLQVLLARTRVDFRDYKQATVNRRIERRMLALGIQSQDEYTQFCRNNPSAVDALFKDLLISVTRFFRDMEHFEHLQDMLPELLETKNPGPLRIWIAGCATGEEAYSIAMMLSEALGGPHVILKSQVQIFATDIDKDALKVARAGVYGLSALDDIPADYVEKYVIRQPDGIRVIDNLRNAILFSDHNVCQDPPFQKLDLICCRNLLIYFGNSLQRKVMSRFHYSMNPNALLFLGTAESVAGSDEMFVHDRRTSHIFRKRKLRAQSAHQQYSMPNLPAAPRKTITHPATERPVSTDRQLFEALTQSLGRNSMLVTEDFAIARVYGDISDFIEMTEMSSLKMHLDLLRSPLREEARSLVTIALKNGAKRTGVRHLLAQTDDEEIRLDVYPIIAKDINERAALVVFTPFVKGKVTTTDLPFLKDDSAASQRIRALETEVATTREALQQTVEELETSNEELQSLNEELQSTNEELQATNEELETSNEELQSTNEELITVNEELQVTASELTGRTGELTSVLESTPLAIVVVDSALQVTQATRAATEIFNIQHPIQTPHISQCSLPEGFPTLAPICNQALQLGETFETEFTSLGNLIKITCSPYFDESRQILGVTMVITEFPGLAHEMNMILETDNVFIMQRDANGIVMRISKASANALGTTRENAIGQKLTDLMNTKAANDVLERDTEVLENGLPALNEKVVMKTRANRILSMNMNRYPYTKGPKEPKTIYAIATDMSETVNALNEAEMISTRMKQLQDFAGVGYWEVNTTNNTIFWSNEVFRIHGETPVTYQPDLTSALSFYHPEDQESVSIAVSDALENDRDFKFVKRLQRRDGTTVTVQADGIPAKDDDGNLIGLSGFIREVIVAKD